MARKKQPVTDTRSKSAKYKDSRTAFKYGGADKRKALLQAKLEKRNSVRPKGMSRGLAIANTRDNSSQSARYLARSSMKGKATEQGVRNKAKEILKGNRADRMAKAAERLKGREGKLFTKTKLVGSAVKNQISRVNPLTGKSKIKKRYKALGLVGAYAAYRSVKNRNKEQGR